MQGALEAVILVGQQLFVLLFAHRVHCFVYVLHDVKEVKLVAVITDHRGTVFGGVSLFFMHHCYRITANYYNSINKLYFMSGLYMIYLPMTIPEEPKVILLFNNMRQEGHIIIK